MGQRYRFEDFRKDLESAHRAPRALQQPREDLALLEERLRETEGFFTKLRDKPESSKDRELIQVILDALHFISATAQHSALGEYLEHVKAGAPPYVVASFATKEEAEAWLEKHPHPPVSANVLIANTHHDVVYDRNTNIRRLPRNRDLEYYLAELEREEPPTAIASFDNHEEAEAWLQSQPNPARWAWVSIAGEFYLAAYYPHIGHRALYPLSMAKGY
ncbi:hypothetical protein [Archangium minus]|uniref:hypothetical protein n=1 Tax=Archangium minus TaxID=83450 RepID=UPI0037C08F57